MSTKQERELVIEKSEQILERTIKQMDPEFCRALSNMLQDYIAVTNPRKNMEYRKDWRRVVQLVSFARFISIMTSYLPQIFHTMGIESRFDVSPFVCSKERLHEVRVDGRAGNDL